MHLSVSDYKQIDKLFLYNSLSPAQRFWYDSFALWATVQDQTEDRFPTLESEKSFPAHAGWRLPGLFQVTVLQALYLLLKSSVEISFIYPLFAGLFKIFFYA